MDFISIAIIVGFAGVILVSFWDEIVSWLKSMTDKVKKIVSGVVYGVKVFAKHAKNAFTEIAKYYVKSGNEWEENIVQRKISVNEVPGDILAKADRNYGNEVEIDDDLMLQLGV